MRIYIAGPIGGMPNGNREAFNERARLLKEQGHEPVNPWDIFPKDHDTPCIGGEASNSQGTNHRYGCMLRADIEIMMYCDAISLLPGWADSPGATTEEHVARALGLRIFYD